MALQFSVDVRNAMLDAIETEIGASPTLEIFTGTVPASCAAADSGTVLATITLPADFFQNAASGQKLLNGVWEDSSADANGTAGHFRVKQGATCHMQGTVAASGADLNVSNTSFAAGQPFSVTSFTINAGNA